MEGVLLFLGEIDAKASAITAISFARGKWGNNNFYRHVIMNIFRNLEKI